MCVYSLTDVLSKGTLKSLKDLDDTVIKELACKLPDTTMSGGADATTTKCMGLFRRWKVLAMQYDMEAFPAKNFHSHCTCTSSI